MFKSRLIGLVLVAAVAWIPVAPPEHVHEEEEHGRETLLVHRHLAAHPLSHHATHHNRALDHEDAPVLTLDPVYVIPGTALVISQPPSSAVTMVEPPVGETLRRAREYVERLIHGPPRAPASPRAPPPLSRL